MLYNIPALSESESRDSVVLLDLSRLIEIRF
jgi:hypothetical protein